MPAPDQDSVASTDTPQPDSILNADSIPADATACIIAGSRSATDVLSDDGLQQLITATINSADFSPDAVISGTADGVDTAGETWATDHDLPVAQFPAPWDDTDHPDAVVREGSYGPYDARAGHRRNEWMAQYAAGHGNRGVLVAIIDYPSNGTESMIELGREILGDENVFVVPLGDITDESARADLAHVIHRP